MLPGLVLRNEPNYLSHRDFHLSPERTRLSEMLGHASATLLKINRKIAIVLVGISACGCNLLALMRAYGVTGAVDAPGLYGFLLDWNHSQLNDWPDRSREAARANRERIYAFCLGLLALRG